MSEASLTPDEIRVFRAIKKTAAIYLLLVRLARPAGEVELARILEMDPETARIHLNSLAAIGLLLRGSVHAGWRLSTLGGGLLNGENAEFDPTTTAEEIQESNQVMAAAEEEAETGRFFKARQALRECGIGEPTASRVAALRHVTPEFIRAHGLKARQEGSPSGLLVHRIRCGDPAPELNASGHLSNCTCDACQRAKYRFDE